MKIKIVFIALITAVMTLCLTSCSNPASSNSNPGNQGNGGGGNSENPLYPFEGSSWYGDTYTDFADSDGNLVKSGYEKILEFEGIAYSMNGKTYGMVKIINELYFFWPEGYNNQSNTKYEVLLKNQKLNYSVTKTDSGYTVTMGPFGSDWLTMTISNASATSATIRNTTHGYMSYGAEPSKLTWYSDDLLPRTLTKQ